MANTTVIGTPEDIVQDSAGHIYFLDSFVGVIRKIDANTRILTTIAGNNTAKAFRGDGGPATKAFFNVPSGLAIWQDILYVADQYNGAIRRINLTTGACMCVLFRRRLISPANHRSGGNFCPAHNRAGYR